MHKEKKNVVTSDEIHSIVLFANPIDFINLMYISTEKF